MSWIVRARLFASKAQAHQIGPSPFETCMSLEFDQSRNSRTTEWRIMRNKKAGSYYRRRSQNSHVYTVKSMLRFADDYRVMRNINGNTFFSFFPLLLLVDAWWALMSQQKEAFFVLSLMASSISGGSHYTKISPNKNKCTKNCTRWCCGLLTRHK